MTRMPAQANSQHVCRILQEEGVFTGEVGYSTEAMTVL